jgi:hypothetical protein
MTTTRISPTQVRAHGYIYEFEDDKEAEDFQACATGVDVAYCELEHAVIRKLPVKGIGHSLRSKNRTYKCKVSIAGLSALNFVGQLR